MSTTYVQTIDNLKLYAERSVQDKDGNQIDTTYAKSSDLATVATSGDYDDLTNKPSIPAAQVNADWNAVSGVSEILNKPSLATVATTGAYSDLSGTPSIPTATSDLQNDSGFITLADVPAQVNADWDATSGAGEILNKPTIPSVDQTYDSSSTNAQSGTAVAGAIATVNQVPASTSADQDKVLTVDSLGIPAWAIVPQSPTELFEAAYDITSYSDVKAAITAKKIVYCRVPSGANGYRMAFLAYIGSNNVEFQYYRSMSTHDSTNQGDEVYVYTVASSGWTTKTRWSNIRYKAGTNMTQSYNSSNETLTFSATVPTKTSDLTNDSGFITLSDVPAQVNADWNAASGAAEILNKPSIPTATSDLTNDSGFITLSDVPAQQNADWNAASGVTQILNKPNLATVATTGAYSDLTGTPSIPTATSDLQNDSGFITLSDVPAQVNADWNASSGAAQILNKPTIPSVDQTYDATSTNAQSGVAVASAISTKQDTISDLSTIRSGAQAGATAVQPGDLATVATTGAYSDLTGTPTIPTATSDLTNDSGFITLSDVPAQVNADWNSSSGASEILNKPTIPTVDQTYNSASANAQSGVAVAGALATKQDTISDLSTIRSGAALGATAIQPGDLATVATTGDYSDLLNKPTIPAAQVNSDWNAASGVSQILNKPNLATVATTGAYSDLSGKPTIPTVDQTYNAASTNAQSGTAVAQAIATKEDAFDVGTGLEMDTSGATPTLQVEAPVDIVAGPGIVIDNPDGNTLRVSQQYPTDRTILYTGTTNASPVVLSEVITNFEYIEITWEHNYNSTIINNHTFTYLVPSNELFAYGGRAASSGFVWFIAVWTVGSDNKTLTRSQSKYITITTTVGAPADNNNLFPVKVVGVHRIANN